MENTKFVFIEKYWAYFWSEHNKFLSASEACEILMIKKKLLHKMRVDWTIQEYSDITYWHGGKENCFNLLKDNSKSMLLGDGSPDSPIMIVGEAPGPEEEKTNKTFQGESGAL